MDSVDQNIRIKKQHSLPFHHAIEFFSIGNIHVSRPKIPAWQCLLGFWLTCRKSGCKNAPEPGLYKSGHSGFTPRRLFPQPLHYGIVNVQGRFHMANHITLAITCQFPLLSVI